MRIEIRMGVNPDHSNILMDTRYTGDRTQGDAVVASQYQRELSVIQR
jgi:hypothetical protein